VNFHKFIDQGFQKIGSLRETWVIPGLFKSGLQSVNTDRAHKADKTGITEYPFFCSGHPKYGVKRQAMSHLQLILVTNQAA
jgi:hypothetical protein